jgi:MFS family permease
MSKLIDINLEPDDRTLRQFGIIALVGFGFVAAIAWFEVLIFSFGLGESRTVVAGCFAALAAISALFSLLYPKANLPIYLGLTVLTYPIGFVLSYLIMGTLFYLLLAPVGLFFKLTGRDPLARRLEPEASSYWLDARAARPNESYFKQF